MRRPWTWAVSGPGLHPSWRPCELASAGILMVCPQWGLPDTSTQCGECGRGLPGSDPHAWGEEQSRLSGGAGPGSVIISPDDLPHPSCALQKSRRWDLGRWPPGLSSFFLCKLRSLRDDQSLVISFSRRPQFVSAPGRSLDPRAPCRSPTELLCHPCCLRGCSHAGNWSKEAEPQLKPSTLVEGVGVPLIIGPST